MVAAFNMFLSYFSPTLRSLLFFMNGILVYLATLVLSDFVLNPVLDVKSNLNENFKCGI